VDPNADSNERKKGEAKIAEWLLSEKLHGTEWRDHKVKKDWRRTNNNKHQAPNKSRQKGAARTFWMYVWNCNVKVAALRVRIERWKMPEKGNEYGRILELVTVIGRETNTLYGYGWSLQWTGHNVSWFSISLESFRFSVAVHYCLGLM